MRSGEPGSGFLRETEIANGLSGTQSLIADQLVKIAVMETWKY